MAAFDLKEYLLSRREKVEAVLNQLLPPETHPPGRLHEAMRYSVFAGGKRLRPLLTIASAESAGREFLPEAVYRAGAAVEFLHTYSLVHDDLPCMDDDDLRRGKPTCHKAYDEATAVLVGDGLQALAFQTLSELPEAAAAQRALCVTLLARASGPAGMVGGQMEDMLAEGLGSPTAEMVDSIHSKKTGALLEACCRIGACLGGANPSEMESLGAYGSKLGLAFQIIDDILDIVGEQQELGKTVGKDCAVNKATYPAVHGLEAAKEKAARMLSEARECVERFGSNAKSLVALAEYVGSRSS
jgi:geranylgeranyl pyrophosphate synthase